MTVKTDGDNIVADDIDGKHYWIPRARASEPDWIDHLRRKGWSEPTLGAIRQHLDAEIRKQRHAHGWMN